MADPWQPNGYFGKTGFGAMGFEKFSEIELPVRVNPAPAGFLLPVSTLGSWWPSGD